MNKEYLIESEKLMQMKRYPARRYEAHGTIENCLFGGIMANWQERKFYSQTKHFFVIPTYFSLFGLINIQKKGMPITSWNNVQMWNYILDNCQNKHQPFCDFHTLYEINNFCLDDKHLKIVDYGSRNLQPFIELNGEKLYNNFKAPD